MKNKRKLNEIDAALEDPNQAHVLQPDPFKLGSKEQKGFMNTPYDEQQFETEPDPPHNVD